MSNGSTPILNSCGCCAPGPSLNTLFNRPGLSALAYRIGSYGIFLQRLLDEIHSVTIPDGPNQGAKPLATLTTRAIDDPSIALLDAWAVVADVLTFYQERIANEGYLPTATERRSIMELAALVGYALRPGVAASGYLAFMLQDGYDAEVPPGTRAQTLPGPGEVPESFETGSSLAARAEWNALQPRQTKPQVIETTATMVTSKDGEKNKPIYLKGTATNLKPNDALLLVWGQGKGEQEFRRVMTATPEPAFNRTKVELQLSASSAAAAAVSRAAGALIARLIYPASVPSPQSEIARAVVDILMDAEARRTAASTPAQMAVWFKQTLVRLREQHRLARARKTYTRLEEWIGKVIDDIEDLVRGLPQPAPSVAPPNADPGGLHGPKPLPEPSILQRFDTLLGALAKPPSTPPTSASELSPSLADVFTPGSDQQFEFLTALRPSAGSAYLALANATVTPPNPVG